MKKNRAHDEFAAETELLEEAQAFLQGEASPAELETAYLKLVSDYGKLLKTAVKISRISDIQGRMLIERERELKAATDNLTLAETQRRKLVSDISHELGTPMTSIQGYVKAMIDDVIPVSPAYLRMIYGKVQFVNRLVADLFQLSRLEASKIPFTLRKMSPEELLRTYDGKFAVDAQKAGIRLTVEPICATGPQAQSLAVKADPVRIEQVMTNFVHNAIKFTQKGGTIRIETEIGGGGNGPGGRTGTMTVRVIDSGIGIREENLPFVFERFYRVRLPEGEAAPGTGLGLAISKEIVLRHNGTIGVDSTPGEGSTFFFTLPLCE